LLGGLLGVLRLGLLSYWMNGYWSASIVALGGALVAGALPRLKRNPRIRDSALLALGLVILANTRPYEGFIFAFPVAVVMLVWMFRRSPFLRQMVGRFSSDPPIGGTAHREAADPRPAGPARRLSLRGSFVLPVLLPIGLILGTASVATGYYYHRVTGNAFRMTYQVNRGTYATAPYFLWQSPRPEPQYHHAVMRDFYRWELQKFESYRTLRGLASRNWDKLFGLWQFYLGPVLTIPLLALPRVLRDRRMRVPLIILGVFAIGLAVETWTLPHYFAPATALLYLVLLQGMRHLRLWCWRRRPIGASLLRAIPVICCAMILLRLVAVTTHAQIEPAWPRGNLDRAQVMRQLARLPGKQLVIVRYGTRRGVEHDVDHEWVYNASDIDHAPVVWARDMGTQNEELLTYFRDRKTWLINGDEIAPQPVPYSFSLSANSQH
jgi:hypothetical protein